MTKQETVQMFAMISVLYPRAEVYASPKPEMVLGWHSILKDLDFSLVQAGIRAHAAISQYPPAIADIRASCLNLTDERMGADEAWGIARKTMRRYGALRAKKAKESTPPDVWGVMERLGYCEMCMSENIDVIRGQFLKMWNIQQERQREQALIPQGLKVLMQDSKLLLGGGH